MLLRNWVANLLSQRNSKKHNTKSVRKPNQIFTQKESSTDEIDPNRYTGEIVAKYKSIAQYANVWVRCFGKQWYSFLYN